MIMPTPSRRDGDDSSGCRDTLLASLLGVVVLVVAVATVVIHVTA